MRVVEKKIVLFLIFVTLTSCSNLNSRLKTSPTVVMETALAEARTSIVETITLIPSITPTSKPTNSPTPLPPTLTPTQTSTPVPSLTSHEWTQSEPLITFGSMGGDGACATVPLEFTLLPNGELYVVDWNDDSEGRQIKTATLSRQNTCNLLNSIDQAGFFDYDPSTFVYKTGIIMGGHVNHISVNAWRSNEIDLYELTTFIGDMDFVKEAWGCGDCLDLGLPTILPSLRKTYQLLNNYEPESLQVYQLKRLGVWVEVDSRSNENNKPIWPIMSIKLSQIVFPEGYTGDDPNIILTGTDAKSVYKLFDERMGCGMDVVDEDQVYSLRARPLLPNEYPFDPPMPTVLSCTPSDGWVEIP